MTTEFIAVPEHAVVDDAIEALKSRQPRAGDDLPDRTAQRLVGAVRS
jgi:hypothetical protein